MMLLIPQLPTHDMVNNGGPNLGNAGWLCRRCYSVAIASFFLSVSTAKADATIRMAPNTE